MTCNGKSLGAIRAYNNADVGGGDDDVSLLNNNNETMLGIKLCMCVLFVSGWSVYCGKRTLALYRHH